MIEVKGKYIKDIPIFNFLTDKNEILLLMEEIVFSPGEYIFNQDKRDDCCLYYLVKGQVELIQTQFQDQEICLAAKSRQEYFGEVSFITGCIRQHSAKAIDFCRVYRINRQQFINTIQQDDRNFELFQMLKDTVIYEKHYDYCSQTCRTCNQKGHYHIYCPKTHLILNKQILAARSFYSQPHFKRINYTRIYRNKYKSLQLIESLKEACYKLSENDEYFDLFNKLERGISQFDEQLSEILNDQFLECINEEDENIISEAQIQQKQIQKSHSLGSEKKNHNITCSLVQDVTSKQGQYQFNLTPTLKELDALDSFINTTSKSFRSSFTSRSNSLNKSISLSSSKLQNKPKNFNRSQSQLSDDISQNNNINYIKYKTQSNKISNELETPPNFQSNLFNFNQIEFKNNKNKLDYHENTNTKNGLLYTKQTSYNNKNYRSIQDINKPQKSKTDINDSTFENKNNMTYQKYLSDNSYIIKESNSDNLQNILNNQITENQKGKYNIKILNSDEDKTCNKGRQLFKGMQRSIKNQETLKLSIIQFLKNLKQQNTKCTQDLMTQGISRSSMLVNKDTINPTVYFEDTQEFVDENMFQIIALFDKSQIYQYYFPNFNYPTVLEKRNRFLIKKFEKKRRDKKFSIQKKSNILKQKFQFSSYLQNL